MTTSAVSTLDHEVAVAQRYSAGAQAQEPSLCCPVDYDPRYLEIIPAEVLERDYGCGDPSRHLRPGDRVLDLGAGGGKIAFIAAQVVGAAGEVIGVDMNADMLDLARRNQPIVAERLGYDNIRFRRGKIQDLRLDVDAVVRWCMEHPIRSPEDYLALERETERLRADAPLIPDGSVDVVVSNCVLNLVRPEDKRTVFHEMFRVLARGGRAVISDIVSDEDVPADMQQDPELWSGCISGAFREDQFLHAFAEAGFHGMRILKRDEQPWQVVRGIEFRAVTVEAFTGSAGPCLERHQAVIYRGPWKRVTDDDGHTLERGVPMAVCDKTYHLYQQAPYGADIVPIPPRADVPVAEAAPFECTGSRRRPAGETKGTDYRETRLNTSDCCAPGGNNC